ncbi:MAG: hypothetical protein WEA09_15290 [Gemmatimonadota bacterium]
MVNGLRGGGDGRGSCEGIALLLTLLALVAATLMAHAAFLLALGEGQGVTRQRQLMEGWAAVEEGLETAPGEGAAGIGRLLELPDGYMLHWMEVELPPPPGLERGPSLQGGRLWWQLDASAEAARLHESGQVAGQAQASGDSPPLRLGPFTLDDWLRLVPWEALERAGLTVAYRYPHGGGGSSVVWAPGSLELPLSGLPQPLEGLLLVEEELDLQGGSTILGGVVTGGGIRVTAEGGGVLWVASSVEEALSLLAHDLGTRAVPGGWLSPFPW